MLFYKTKPNSTEKKEIFYHDSRLIIGFTILGMLAQFWSGFTEFIGLNSYLIDLCSFFLSSSSARILGNSIAFGIALTIEISTFALVTYIVNSFYNGYLKFSKFKNFDKEQISTWIKFILAFTVLVGIIWISSTVSKKNVEHSTQASPPKAKTESTTHFAIEQKEQITAIENRYNLDLNRESKDYEESKELIESQFLTRIEDKKARIADYERLEQRTNKRYSTSKKNLRTAIRSFQIAKTDSLKILKNNHTLKLEQLALIRNQQIEKVEAEIKTDKAIVDTRNRQLQTATDKRNSWLSLFLRQYAQFSVFLFLFARIWVCISLNTCGIRPKILVKPEFFESSIMKDLLTLAYTYPTRRFHNGIRKRLANIPDLIPIEQKGAVINLDNEENLINGNSNPIVDLKLSSQNLSTYENRIYETKAVEVIPVQKEIHKECEYCQTSFISNHKKQRFCKTQCRKTAWEERTGRKLKLKSKKK